MFSCRPLIIICHVIFLWVGSVFAETPTQIGGQPLKSTTGAVFRSLIIPGWGQFYNESYVKSFVFFAGETALAISISHESDLMQRYKKGKDFQNEKFFRNSRNKLIWWLSGTILLSMGDAYVDAQLFGLDITPTLSLENDRTVGFSAALHF